MGYLVQQAKQGNFQIKRPVYLLTKGCEDGNKFTHKNLLPHLSTTGTDMSLVMMYSDNNVTLAQILVCFHYSQVFQLRQTKP